MLYEPQEYGAVLKTMMMLCVGTDFSSNHLEAKLNSDIYRDLMILVGMSLAKPGRLANGYMSFSLTKVGQQYLQALLREYSCK